MNALWQILLKILWRLRPVQALEVNILDAIQIGFITFTEEAWLDLLTHSLEERRRTAAALFDAHRKLDLLIYHRACEIAGITSRLGFKPDYSWTHSSTDMMALWRSFERFVAKYDDYERYALKRAERLKREQTTIPPSLRDSLLRLDAAHQSTSPVLCAVEANHLRTLNVQIASLNAQHWGRWIARPCAQDGGGRAFARGPPTTPHSQFPTPHLARPTRENAPACPTAAAPFTPPPAMLVSRLTRREGGVP